MKKVNFSWIIEVGFLFLILWAGKLVWQTFGQQPAFDQAQLENSFQYWLWLHRGPDLAVQIGLIFAGALGIAALLPSKKENGND